LKCCVEPDARENREAIVFQTGAKTFGSSRQHLNIGQIFFLLGMIVSEFFRRLMRAVVRYFEPIILDGNLRVVRPLLTDSATPSNSNASNILTSKDNIMLNPIFGMLSSRAIQNIPDMIGYR